MGHHDVDLLHSQRPWPLPALPQALAVLCERFEGEPFSPSAALAIVSREPSLLVQTLRAAPAVVAAHGSIAQHLEAALDALGKAGLERLVRAILARHLDRLLTPHAASELDRHWRQALSTALCAKQITARLDPAQTELAFYCGLLTGIGQVPKGPVPSADDAPRSEPDARSPSHRHDPWMAPGWPSSAASARALLTQIPPLRLVADVLAYARRPPAELEQALPLVKTIAVAGSLSLDGAAQDSPFVTDLLARYSGLAPDAFLQARQAAAAEFAQVRALFAGDIEDTAQRTGRASSSLPAALVSYIGRQLDADACAPVPGRGRAAQPEGSWEQLAHALWIQYQIEPMVVWAVVEEGGEQSLTACFSSAGPDGQPLMHRLPLSERYAPGRAWLQRQAVFLGIGTAAGDRLGDRQLLEVLGSAGLVCLPLGPELGRFVLMAGLAHAELGSEQAQHALVARVYRLAAACAPAPSADATVDETADAPASQGEAESSAAQLSHLMLRKTVHEINTPLSVMKNYLSVLSLKLPEADAARSEIDVLGEEIDRVNTLLQQLTESVRDERPQWLSVNALVTDMVSLVRQQPPSAMQVQIRVDLDQGLPLIFSARDRIKQILLNLVKNAFEAQPDGGRIELITQRVSDASTPNSIRLIVRDQGPGLTDAIQARLFEPFNSSKPAQGHGLGLYIVRTAVASLGGSIHASNRADRGAEFVIELPVDAGAAAAHSAATDPAPSDHAAESTGRGPATDEPVLASVPPVPSKSSAA